MFCRKPFKTSNLACDQGPWGQRQWADAEKLGPPSRHAGAAGLMGLGHISATSPGGHLDTHTRQGGQLTTTWPYCHPSSFALKSTIIHGFSDSTPYGTKGHGTSKMWASENNMLRPLIFPPEKEAFLNMTLHTQSSQDKEIHLQRSRLTQTPKYAMQNRMPDMIFAISPCHDHSSANASS